jgi:hypothetical protein
MTRNTHQLPAPWTEGGSNVKLTGSARQGHAEPVADARRSVGGVPLDLTDL